MSRSPSLDAGRRRADRPARQQSRLRRLLLWPWPPRLRRRHGSDLLELYDDAFHGGRPEGRWSFWIRSLADALRHGLAARREERRRQRAVYGGRRQGRERTSSSGPPGRSRTTSRMSRRTSPPSSGGPGRSLQGLTLELRAALRTVRRNPGLTVATVLTLALAVGANTAIFSIVHGVMIEPLPFPDSHRIVRIYGRDLDDPHDRSQVSLPNLLDVATASTSFAAVSPVDGSHPIWSGPEGAERLVARFVGASFFEITRVEPMLGRAFTPTDEGPEGYRVVLLSHGFWIRRFAADPDVIGRTLRLNGHENTIVGVLPRTYDRAGLRFETSDVDLYRAWPYGPEDRPRGGRSMAAVGRLAAGVTLTEAQAEVDTIYRRLEEEYPRNNRGRGMVLVPLREAVVGNVEPTLVVLLAAVGVVLLIGCTNVANLLLARSLQRRRELAVRAALGAGRRRLVRQLLMESVVLGGLGGLAGVTAAAVLTKQLVGFGASWLPRAQGIRIDVPVLGFALAVTLTAGLLTGLVPALRASTSPVASVLRAGGSGSLGGGPARGSRILVVAEVALAVVLLTAAGLLLRSLDRLGRVDPGFDTPGVAAAELFPLGTAYGERAAVRNLTDRLLSGARALPGVDAAGIINILPMAGNYSCDGAWRADRRPEPGEGICVETRAVVGEYFRTMRIPLLSGPGFAGDPGADDAPVAIVSRSLAEHFWPGEDPLGKRVVSVHGEESREVVGVVGDVRHFGLAEDPPMQLYLPMFQDPWGWIDLFLVARAGDGRAESLSDPLRALVRDIDPDIAVPWAVPTSDLVSDSVATERFRTTLLASFAATALLLAAVGLYGVLATAVGRRRGEIGLRMALGADGPRVLRHVVGQGLSWVGAGLAAGLLVSLGTTRLLSGLLFGVPPWDPVTLAAVTLVLLGVATAACWLPARQATRVDPVRALQEI